MTTHALAAPPIGARPRAQTAGYFGGHVVLGLVSASLGPTLPALAANIAGEPESLGPLFTARGLGYLLGSISCGRLYDRRAAHPLLALAVVIMAACMCVVPLMPNRVALLAVMLVLGGGQGLLDVGNNTALVRVHGAGVAPYMNALHCSYGIGAIVSPFVIDAAGTLGWAYATLALSSLPVAAWLMTIASPALPDAGSEEATTAAKHAPTLLLLFVVLFSFCQAAEAGFSAWIYVIAQNAAFTDTAAARLLSGFWATFTCGRVISIVIATRVRPRHMLAADLLAAIACMVVLLVVPGPLGLWVGSLGLGLAIASVFPAALALAGESMTLSGAITSRIFVGASLGAMAVPWLLGESFRLGPRAPLVLLVIDLLLALLVFVLIRAKTRRAAAAPA